MRRPSPGLLPSRFFAASLTLAATAGCSSPPPIAPNVPVPPTNETAVVAGPSATDTSPVSAPKNMVLFVVGNDVAKSVASIDRILKLTSPLRPLLDKAMEKENAGFISLSGSFDFAVALDPQSSDKEPKFVWAASIPITSVEAAAEASRKDGDEVRTTTVGAYRTKTKSGNTVCDITPALGDATARVVCSDDEEGLRELSPWLTRGAPLQPKKNADVWMRADAGPLKERYMTFLRQQADEALGEVVQEGHRIPFLDQELLDVPGVLSHEALAFADDTDNIEMSFSLDANKPEVRVDTTLGFKSRTSWLTELIARGSEHAEPPPDFFFRLPKDATTATWSRAADPTMFTGIRHILHKAAGAGLTAVPFLNDTDRRSFVGWLDAFPSFSGMWVSSSGGPSFKSTPSKGKVTPAQAIDEAKEMARRYLPWGISGGEGDPTAMIAWMKQSEESWGRGVSLVKKELGKQPPKELSLLPTVKFTPNAAGYPKGSATLDIDVKFTSKEIWSFLPENKFQEQPDGKWGSPEHPKGAEAHGNITLRIAVVPDDAGHYWFGYSVDPEVLKKHLLAALKGAPTAGTLAARTDLDLLKSHKGFGGFFSYGTLIDSLKTADLSKGDARDLNEAINAMPHKGQAPLFFLGSGTGGSSPTIALEIVAQKDWVEDVAGVARLLTQKAMDKTNDKTRPDGGGGAPPPPPPPPKPPSKVPSGKGPPKKVVH